MRVSSFLHCFFGKVVSDSDAADECDMLKMFRFFIFGLIGKFWVSNGSSFHKNLSSSSIWYVQLSWSER